MKPFLPFAVLAVLVCFLAEGPRPAQASSSVAEKFEEFGHKVKDLAENIASKTKEAFREFSTKARNWFKHTFQKIKDTFSK
ncbi:apolipoprotein C-I [Trichosurus vulpecula]|uniref:apolipoprotein C-I n=1 Tax=Trichosurus vulpecula TaxID=9337 RepID=UPI00186B27E9|nr:apolipoprotein C-I [Trichosurus vulpecula]